MLTRHPTASAPAVVSIVKCIRQGPSTSLRRSVRMAFVALLGRCSHSHVSRSRATVLQQLSRLIYLRRDLLIVDVLRARVFPAEKRTVNLSTLLPSLSLSRSSSSGLPGAPLTRPMVTRLCGSTTDRPYLQQNTL